MCGGMTVSASICRGNGLATSNIVSVGRSREKQMLALRFFPLFICSEVPVCGMVLPTFLVDLPTSVKPHWKQAHRHTQKYVSWVILSFIKFTQD